MDGIVIVLADTNDVTPEYYSVMLKDDINLTDTINRYISQLSEIDSGLEICKREHNIVTTNRGYYCAFYQSDLLILGEN